MGRDEITLRGPLWVQADITTSCSLSCRYCYASHWKEERHIDTERFLELLAEMDEMGVFLLLLAGGEPLRHPDFFRILEAAIQTRMSVSVLTNGTESPELAVRLAECHKNIHPFVVQVSLDHPSEAVNDRTRGKTASVRQFIHTLAENGLTPQIATVITTVNKDRLGDLFHAFHPTIRAFHFMNLMPPERPTRELDSLMPTDEQLRDSYALLAEQMRNFPDIRVSHPQMMCSPTATSLFRESTAEGHGCTACGTHVGIAPNLDMVACSLVPSSVVGSLRESGMKELWNSAQKSHFETFPEPICQARGDCPSSPPQV
ncbi:MAG: radical SAM protein [Pseudodesulfovibrio sp.]|uniref:Radical SAM domain protein n=1 Tax=Pseudodesulfovibrio aespoeensis (strain ATCC 700646 / DSM 10631 / Aspo-2) TaxID=643562 RepID=E6VUP9_PSEA9|nr:MULTISPECIES: radical SAM protein [Pseudodesulfovibrio]MBU4193309.1 radical SAM protein [Pseudomonadota bacterium]ADU62290.1 Radical SAM domain protein [Pseudodesulfovibrio aespoeensis Aspo-2]MBU4243340.1 radical SAM protein [Pseudomonadota bacterium]MBU4380506.1 radical SAM protein [Pseudomonadota bacterium]MBU4474045.1 radical SAM protein [Pseudomonadota bacterium]